MWTSVASPTSQKRLRASQSAGGLTLTTDVHQQRQKARPFEGRRCVNCHVALFEGECARLVGGVWERVNVCIHCDVNGPPRLSLIHISEPTRLGMISYAVFCLKKKKKKK